MRRTWGVVATMSLIVAALFLTGPTCLPPEPELGPTEAELDADGDGFTPSQGDCQDDDPLVFPAAEEIPYDGIDQDCTGFDLTDVDEDGWDAAEVGGEDCNDLDVAIHPDADEVPYDSIDNDCQEGDLVDVDGDGYDASEVGGEDCDDLDSGVHPGIAVDDCGNGDEDCDDLVDEDQDVDGDGVTSCAGDCNDEDAATYPGAPEVPADGIDQNCNGHDMGNCSTSIYGATWTLTFSFTGTGGCNPCVQFTEIEQFQSVTIPEYAMCAGSTVSWEGTMSLEDSSMTGNWSWNSNNGCGSFSGSGTQYGSTSCSCDYVSGSFGFGGKPSAKVGCLLPSAPRCSLRHRRERRWSAGGSEITRRPWNC